MKVDYVGFCEALGLTDHQQKAVSKLLEEKDAYIDKLIGIMGAQRDETIEMVAEFKRQIKVYSDAHDERSSQLQEALMK